MSTAIILKEEADLPSPPIQEWPKVTLADWVYRRSIWSISLEALLCLLKGVRGRKEYKHLLSHIRGLRIAETGRLLDAVGVASRKEVESLIVEMVDQYPTLAIAEVIKKVNRYPELKQKAPNYYQEATDRGWMLPEIPLADLRKSLAILLVGNMGSGKNTTAQWISQKHQDWSVVILDSHGQTKSTGKGAFPGAYKMRDPFSIFATMYWMLGRMHQEQVDDLDPFGSNPVDPLPLDQEKVLMVVDEYPYLCRHSLNTGDAKKNIFKGLAEATLKTFLTEARKFKKKAIYMAQTNRVGSLGIDQHLREAFTCIFLGELAEFELKKTENYHPVGYPCYFNGRQVLHPTHWLYPSAIDGQPPFHLLEKAVNKPLDKPIQLIKYDQEKHQNYQQELDLRKGSMLSLNEDIVEAPNMELLEKVDGELLEENGILGYNSGVVCGVQEEADPEFSPETSENRHTAHQEDLLVELVVSVRKYQELGPVSLNYLCKELGIAKGGRNPKYQTLKLAKRIADQTPTPKSGISITTGESSSFNLGAIITGNIDESEVTAKQEKIRYGKEVDI